MWERHGTSADDVGMLIRDEENAKDTGKIKDSRGNRWRGDGTIVMEVW